jgi:hypothetical protein
LQSPIWSIPATLLVAFKIIMDGHSPSGSVYREKRAIQSNICFYAFYSLKLYLRIMSPLSSAMEYAH